MGAGASVEGIPADKMDRFKEKLMNVDSMKDEQKLRLLEQMAYELKKVSPKDETVRQFLSPPKRVLTHAAHARTDQPFRRLCMRRSRQNLYARSVVST